MKPTNDNAITHIMLVCLRDFMLCAMEYNVQQAYKYIQKTAFFLLTIVNVYYTTSEYARISIRSTVNSIKY